jgi:hypothetical protein
LLFEPGAGTIGAKPAKVLRMRDDEIAASGWATLRVRGGAEEVVERNLRSHGWRVYLPQFRKYLRGVRIGPGGRRIRSRTGDIVFRPLFGPYVFCEIWPGQSEHALIVTPGVMQLLRQSIYGKPGPLHLLRGEVIEEIRAAVAAGVYDEARPTDRPVKRTDLQIGDRVRTSHGIVAELLDLDERNRALLLMSWLGADRRTMVDAAELELVRA